MPSITNGTTTHPVIQFDGQVQPLGLQLEDVTRPGVDGHAYRRVARHGPPFELVAHLDVDDNAAADATFRAMVAAYQGRAVTVVDDMGTSHAGLMCLGVRRVDAFRVLSAVGGISAGKGAMLVAAFLLQSTQ